MRASLPTLILALATGLAGLGWPASPRRPAPQAWPRLRTISGPPFRAKSSPPAKSSTRASSKVPSSARERGATKDNAKER